MTIKRNSIDNRLLSKSQINMKNSKNDSAITML